MRHQANAIQLIVLSMLSVTSFAAFGTPTALWQERPLEAAAPGQTTGLPKHYRVFALDAAKLSHQLGAAPAVATPAESAPRFVELPLPDGGFRTFRLVPSGVMPEELAAKYPSIRSFKGQAVNDPSVQIRLSWSPNGLNAMILEEKDVVLIQPQGDAGNALYLSFYWRHAAHQRDHDHNHGPDFRINPRVTLLTDVLVSAAEEQGFSYGDQRRTYTIAMAADSGFVKQAGGTREKALAAIEDAVNDLSGLYERELSVNFQLAKNSDRIIFIDPQTDPYAGKIGDSLLEANQQILDREIGPGSYDVGHLVFKMKGGSSAGLAMTPSVCDSQSKAQGYTGGVNPKGDTFWIDFVAHEIGHQLGAHHTFNSVLGGCGGGNRSRDNAYEIGSGVTIMAYASLCDEDDIQDRSIPYFHARSLEQVYQNVWFGDGAKCGTTQSTGNNPPTVNAGVSGLTIPKETPFFLRGQGNDLDGDRISYAWDEYDLASKPATVNATKRQNPSLDTQPLFRSFNPSKASDMRVYPRLQTILDDRSGKGEVLPGYSRSLAFRLVARDGKGGVAVSPVRSLNVNGDAGPFQITKPAGQDIWSIAAGKATVEWAVAGTDLAPISCPAVNIALSIDGGKSFGRRLAAGVPNNGSYGVDVPTVATKEARIRIGCPGQVFANISASFLITE
jgi:hypothetical protein